MGQKVANAPVRPFLTAEWRDLLMVNFAVDPSLLAPHVPAEIGRASCRERVCLVV